MPCLLFSLEYTLYYSIIPRRLQKRNVQSGIYFPIFLFFLHFYVNTPKSNDLVYYRMPLVIIWQYVISANKKYDIMSLGDLMRNRLKELRKSRGYTQVSVQMQTGIEQALLSKIENGERIPTTETLVRLAEFYNVSIDYILYRTNKPEINR